MACHPSHSARADCGRWRAASSRTTLAHVRSCPVTDAGCELVREARAYVHSDATGSVRPVKGSPLVRCIRGMGLRTAREVVRSARCARWHGVASRAWPGPSSEWRHSGGSWEVRHRVVRARAASSHSHRVHTTRQKTCGVYSCGDTVAGRCRWRTDRWCMIARRCGARE